MSAFDKFVGYNSIKQEMIKLCDILKNKEHYLEFGITIPNAILFIGRPGSGKTLMAKCLAEESGYKTYIIRKNRSSNDFVNQISETFYEASNNLPAIVILDDLDRYSNEKNNAEEYITVQICIDNYSDKIFVIATVNHYYELPDSLLRSGRLGKQIRFFVPSEEDEIKIIKHYINFKKVMLQNIDIVELSRILSGYSCADIEEIINSAGIEAVYNKHKYIENDDFFQAILRFMYNCPLSNTSVYDSVDRMRVAYHEAGHALISEILYNGSVSLISANNESIYNQGITKIYIPTSKKDTFEYAENNIIIGFGGRAATEIVYGEIDTGIATDRQEARLNGSMIVEDYLASGFDISYSICDSDQTKRISEEKIANLMQKYYDKAKIIIANNREFLDKLTSELMEKPYLLQNDIQLIKNRCKIII